MADLKRKISLGIPHCSSHACPTLQTVPPQTVACRSHQPPLGPGKLQDTRASLVRAASQRSGKGGAARSGASLRSAFRPWSLFLFESLGEARAHLSTRCCAAGPPGRQCGGGCGATPAASSASPERFAATARPTPLAHSRTRPRPRPGAARRRGGRRPCAAERRFMPGGWRSARRRRGGTRAHGLQTASDTSASATRSDPSDRLVAVLVP
jgi:hypothetical protein